MPRVRARKRLKTICMLDKISKLLLFALFGLFKFTLRINRAIFKKTIQGSKYEKKL